MGDLTASTPARRVEAIDAVRGTVMILMALDHVRDFVHHGAMSASPTDLATTTPVLFLTRAWFDRLGLKQSNPLGGVWTSSPVLLRDSFLRGARRRGFLATLRYGGGALDFVFHPVPSMGGPPELSPSPFGYDLWVVYLVWALLVLALYPACR